MVLSDITSSYNSSQLLQYIFPAHLHEQITILESNSTTYTIGNIEVSKEVVENFYNLTTSQEVFSTYTTIETGNLAFNMIGTKKTSFDHSFLVRADGLFVFDSSNEKKYQTGVSNIDSVCAIFDVAPWIEHSDKRNLLGSKVSDGLLDNISFSTNKIETVYSGLSIEVPESSDISTTINLLNKLDGLTPDGGFPIIFINENALNISNQAFLDTNDANRPFLDTVNGKLVGINSRNPLFFRITTEGTFGGGGGSSEVAMRLPFSTPLDIIQNEGAFTTDRLSFARLVSVDVDGETATNGIDILMASANQIYTISKVKIVIEQLSS